MVEFCGLGKVRLDADEPEALGPSADYRYLEALTEKTRARWLASLLNSDDLRARAAGLFMQGTLAGDFKSERAATQEARDELLQLAVGANDPAIYAMAVYKCRGFVDGSASVACPQISWKGWARADPDNAAPWIGVAGLARADNDPAAESDAVNHAAQAHRQESYQHSLFSFAESALPDDVSALERSFIAAQVIGIEAALPTPPYLPVSRHCSTEAVQDAGVKKQCATLADLLTTHSGSLLDFAIGLSIGKRAGWPAARIDAMEQEKNAMMESIRQVAPYDSDPWSCASVARLNDYVHLRAQLGEVGAARELRERSGESVPALARKYADAMEEFRRDAERRAQDHPQEPQP
jgi:hypothetical protein